MGTGKRFHEKWAKNLKDRHDVFVLFNSSVIRFKKSSHISRAYINYLMIIKMADPSEHMVIEQCPTRGYG